MSKGLIKKIFYGMSHDEAIEYATKMAVKYNFLTTSDLQKIINEYDGRSPLRRFFADDRDLINYKIAEGIIKRRKEAERK